MDTPKTNLPPSPSVAVDHLEQKAAEIGAQNQRVETKDEDRAQAYDEMKRIAPLQQPRKGRLIRLAPGNAALLVTFSGKEAHCEEALLGSE